MNIPCLLLGAALVALPAAQASSQGSLLESGRGLLERLPSGGGGGAGAATGLGQGEIAAGLREALKVGSARVVDLLGRTDGFNAAPDVHIPLPGSLQSVQKALQRVGMSSLADDLELRLNRAAEAATPKAREFFIQSVDQMSIEDARTILNGPKDSATQYFRRQMSGPLAKSMRPIVDAELAQAGAVQSYDRMMGQYRSLPLVADAKADLTGYALEKSIAGIFLMLGREEAAIRENPARRTTELLRKVFG